MAGRGGEANEWLNAPVKKGGYGGGAPATATIPPARRPVWDPDAFWAVTNYPIPQKIAPSTFFGHGKA